MPGYLSSSFLITRAGTPPRETIRRDVLGNNRTSSDDRPVADAHAGQNRGACSNPATLADGNIAIARLSGASLSSTKLVSGAAEHNLGSNFGLLADCYFAWKSHASVKTATVANKDIWTHLKFFHLE